MFKRWIYPVVAKQMGIFSMIHQINITGLHSFLRVSHSRPPASCLRFPWLINTCIENDGNLLFGDFACERVDRGRESCEASAMLRGFSPYTDPELTSEMMIFSCDRSSSNRKKFFFPSSSYHVLDPMPTEDIHIS